jgi:hypothetical protein
MSLFKWLPTPPGPGNGPRQLPPLDRTGDIADAARQSKDAGERTLALLAMRDFAKDEILRLQGEADRAQRLMDTLQAFVTVVEDQCR